MVIGLQHFEHFLAILKISFKLKGNISFFATKDVLDVISGIGQIGSQNTLSLA